MRMSMLVEVVVAVHWFGWAESPVNEALDAVGGDDHSPDWRWTSSSQVNCRTSDCAATAEFAEVVSFDAVGPVDLDHSKQS